MSGQKNKAAIGAFVLGAIVLLVIGVVVFGSGKFMADTEKYVVYFEGSVKGLNEGSPVIFRGVKVGSVTEIHIGFDPKTMTATIPVYVEIKRDKFHGIEKGKTYREELIEKGMRAQLQVQSLVTGQLAIYIDFFPDTPVVMRGTDTKYPEIPSILSTTAELQKTLAELPLEELVDKMHSAMEGIDSLVNSPALHEAVDSLGTTSREIQTMVSTINQEVKSLGQDSRKTADAATAALKQVEIFLKMEEGASAEMARNINEALVEARTTFVKTEQTLEAVRRTASDDRTFYQLQQALREMAEAARSINTLVDYLDRHPEALLQGKKALKGE
jgi:paraquat-inducible protein B